VASDVDTLVIGTFTGERIPFALNMAKAVFLGRQGGGGRRDIRA
jgi:hypothetical protein